MIRLVNTFIKYWRDYSSFAWYWSRHQDRLQELIDAGEYMYSCRFDYPFRNTMVWWKHRDRYSRKCEKVNGDCGKCKAKHC